MSVRESSIDRAISHHTDRAWATVGEPIRSAALFYALYYLVEVEGVTEAAFDFKQRRELAAEGFYWYGVATVTSELSHLDDRYFIEGEPVTAWFSDDNGWRVTEHVRRDLFPDDEERGDKAKKAFVRLPEFWTIADPKDFEATLHGVQQHFDGVDEPASYLRFVLDLMEATPHLEAGPDVVRADGLTGWAHGYNGPPWRRIVEHLLRRDEISDTAFVDTSWSIEHHNRRWIDKIDLHLGAAQNAAAVEVGGIEPRRGSTIAPGQAIHAVVDILDAARDGPTGRLFDWAEHFDRDVEVSLRRWRQRLNIR